MVCYAPLPCVHARHSGCLLGAARVFFKGKDDRFLLSSHIFCVYSLERRSEMQTPVYQWNISSSAPGAAFEFLRAYWKRFLVISAAIVVPCFWHRHLEAGDVASHTYNAWLAELIGKGRAPGLVLVHQSQNVLFDLTVARLGNLFGLAWAEKIAVSIAVLLFFWGAFALACTLSPHRQNPPPIPWFLASCIAVFAYGYTLEAGFMNYYLSIGLAFWGLAVIGQSDAQSVGSVAPNGLVFVLLIPIIWLANPLGVAVLLSCGSYIFLAKLLPARSHLYLFVAALLLLLALHLGIKFRHLDTPWFASQVGHMSNGADQLLLGAERYLVPVYLFEFLVIGSLLFDIVQGWRRRQWLSYLLPVQLYSLSLIAVLALPTGIKPPVRLFGPMNALIFLKERMTSVVAVFACCLLARIRPQSWHYAGFPVLAAIFFSNLYWDTSKISGVEDQVDKLVASIPSGQRVIEETLVLAGLDRVGMVHIIDRACIGRCFSYGNYEPSSGQFRVRSQSENPVVLTTNAGVDAVRLGTYVVQPRDLPLYDIYQCVEGTMVLCLRELHAGQVSDRIP